MPLVDTSMALNCWEVRDTGAPGTAYNSHRWRQHHLQELLDPKSSVRAVGKCTRKFGGACNCCGGGNSVRNARIHREMQTTWPHCTLHSKSECTLFMSVRLKAAESSIRFRYLLQKGMRDRERIQVLDV